MSAVVDEVRMVLAEAGYPNANVRGYGDGWFVILDDRERGEGGVPTKVWWRLTQTLAAQSRHGCTPWCWTCVMSGYEADQCEATVAFADDCERDR